MSDYDYLAYTDGGWSWSRNEGAFAYIILQKDKDNNELNIIKSGAYKRVDETINRMEMKAVLAVLLNLPEGSSVLIRSDSQYTIKVLGGTWMAKENLDLVGLFGRYCKERNLRVRFEWVRGHNGEMYNEMCDQMCDDVVGYDLNEEVEKYRRYKK